MKLRLLITALVLTAAFSSCKKDHAENWVGIYNGTSGNNTVQRVVITKVNNNTVKMELQTNFLGTYVSFATLVNGKVNSSTVTVDEDGTVAGTTGTWHLTGSGSRSGNAITLTGHGTQAGQSDLHYVFSGSK